MYIFFHTITFFGLITFKNDEETALVTCHNLRVMIPVCDEHI